ncbi:MAG: Hsp20/alpha crystallin family protein [Pseudomonadota bacterium]
MAKKSAPKTAPARAGDIHPLLSLREGIDRMFDEFLHGFSAPSFFGANLGGRLGPVFGDVFPRIDMSETDKQVEITAELPGLDEKDVSATLSDGYLNIAGEKKIEREEKKKNRYLSERSYGSFRRSFRLPETVDANKIEATFEKGVLKIVLAKRPGAEATAKTIKIRQT